MVLGVVRLEFEAITLGNRQRYLQGIDRIETESLAEERCRRVDIGCAHLEVHCIDQQHCNLEFHRR